MSGTAIGLASNTSQQYPNGFVEDQMNRELELIERRLISKVICVIFCSLNDKTLRFYNKYYNFNF